jgi:hypothetical protein
METHRHSNGLLTFFEHYWLMVVTVSAVVMSMVLSFFSQLTGAPWIWCYGIGLFIAGVGVSLIFYSKLPLYRLRRFFTFGSAALPESRRPFYRRGYRCILFAAALLLCLLLSRP